MKKFLLTLLLASFLFASGKEFELGSVAYERGDFKTAVKYWSQDCLRGGGVSCPLLGTLYENGQGIEQSYKNAFIAYKKGCDNGIAWSCGNLAALYEQGLGTHSDYTYARELYEGACQNGDERSCNKVAEFKDRERE